MNWVAPTSYAFSELAPAHNWIGGSWVPAASGATDGVVNPRHNRVASRVAMSGAEDVDRAVAVAAAAQPAWAALPMRERAHVMYRLRALMERDLEEMAWVLSHENGKVYSEAVAEVAKAIECVEFGCALPNMAAGGQLDVSRGVNCQVTYRALGVCAGVVPFNFPTMVPMWMIPQVLVGGNAFILKPSEKTPLGAVKLAALLEEAGLPTGIFQLVQGGREAVEALCDHPGIEALAFVGSTPIAKAVYGRAAATGKRALCLGGAKNHLIVVPDADLEMTAQNVAASFTGCAGQRCMAASVLVAVGDTQRHIDAVRAHASRLVLGETLGPIITPEARARIVDYIDQAEAAGAEVLLDGRRESPPTQGNWVGATILDRVEPYSPSHLDEIFGPVLSVIRVPTLDEALALHRASQYGNAASIYTSDGGTARYAVERMTSGMCGINIGVPVPREPFGFGGFKASKFGHGDITGWDGFRFWTRIQKVTGKWALQSDATWMG